MNPSQIFQSSRFRGRWCLGIALGALVLGKVSLYLQGNPWPYLLGGIVLLFVGSFFRRIRQNYKYLLAIGLSGILFTETLFLFVRNQFQLSNLLEHSLMWTTPLWVMLGFFYDRTAWRALFLLSIAFTFMGHGLYAMGWPYPVPGHFLGMVREILGLKMEAAQQFLWIMGGLDLLACAGLIGSRTRPYALGYMVIWGLITATARPWAYVHDWQDLWPWLPQMLIRLTHGLMPLYALILEGSKGSNSGLSQAAG